MARKSINEYEEIIKTLEENITTKVKEIIDELKRAYEICWEYGIVEKLMKNVDKDRWECEDWISEIKSKFSGSKCNIETLLSELARKIREWYEGKYDKLEIIEEELEKFVRKEGIDNACRYLAGCIYRLLEIAYVKNIRHDPQNIGLEIYG